MNADQTVGVRQVTVGVTQGDQTSIDKGVSPDELVVVDGTEKLKEGTKVDVQTPGGKTPRTTRS